MYDKSRRDRQKEKVSILNDIDFELELIHRDEINVAYILKLLAKLKDSTEEEKEKQYKSIIDIISGDAQLRSKRELIEQFIQNNLPLIADSEDIPEEFQSYMDKKKLVAIEKISTEENLDANKLQKLIGDYLRRNRISQKSSSRTLL